MPLTPALEINELLVRLHGITVLNRFSLKIEDNEFVVIAGENGAGKTTLLRAILGLAPLCYGVIRINGRNADRSSWRVLRRGIGYVPQVLSFESNMPMSVRDVVAIGRCSLAGLGKRLGPDDWEAVKRAADETGIAHLLDRPIGRLSGGERQKMQIARALCQEPRMLLLDEPTSHLDMAARIECLELLGRLHAAHGFPILMVTHDLPSIPACCKRAVLMNKGEKLFDGGVCGMLDEQMLCPVFGNRAGAVLRAVLASRENGLRND